MSTTGRGDRGQSTVELALILPLVVLFVLLLLQAGLVVRDQVLLTHAAREAARAASVATGDRAVAARRSAERSSALASDRLAVDTELVDDGRSVQVVVRYHSVTKLPFIGSLVPDPILRTTAAMRIESVENRP
ncbi:MAG: TadE/TadG family type IV pilus assembly protein [Acidimicrobiia bacterium]